MKKSHYLPKKDSAKVTWLNNFALKFSAVATQLGLTAADVTAVNSYSAMFTWLMNVTETLVTTKEKFVNYKNLIRSGSIGSTAGTFPTLPVLPTAPASVPTGIFPIIANIISRIKNHPNYTEAIGHDLGIIGSDQILDTASMKPVLKLSSKGGIIEVQWSKGEADAIRIEVDRDTTGFQFLAIDTVPHYTDTAAIIASSKWKYRAIYLINDEAVGQWSDVVSITVG